MKRKSGKFGFWFFGTAIILIFAACVARESATDSNNPEGMFALVNCTLIDGTGGDPVENGALVIQAGRITAVGHRSMTAIPGCIPVIDVAGAAVMPGFINAHVHHGFDRYNLATWARAGVTTVRDLCGPTAFDLRDQLLADPNCARLVAAGPMVSVPGGYPETPWGSSCMLPVTSVQDARTEVLRLLESGADIIKLAIESGESFGLEILTLNTEEASAIVHAAHEYGTVASCHVLTSSDLGRALDVDVDDIAHMVVDSLADSLVSRMVSGGIYWVPTLELWYAIREDLGDAAVYNLRKFVLAGGMVAMGTDYDGYDAPFELGMPMIEMRAMRRAGMSPAQIIVAATRNAAATCNLLDDLGTLEAGKVADILVVGGDPLSDIDALTNVRMVIRTGVIIRREDL